MYKEITTLACQLFLGEKSSKQYVTNYPEYICLISKRFENCLFLLCILLSSRFFRNIIILLWVSPASSRQANQIYLISLLAGSNSASFIFEIKRYSFKQQDVKIDRKRISKTYDDMGSKFNSERYSKGKYGFRFNIQKILLLPLHLYRIKCNLIKCHNVMIKNQIKSIKFYIISSCFLQP